MIADFIESEISYFEPMLLRQRNASEEMKMAWKNETVVQRIERVSLETWHICRGEVKYGPFKGMKLNKDTWWGKCDLGSQCLGLYEKEILDFISTKKLTRRLSI